MTKSNENSALGERVVNAVSGVVSAPCGLHEPTLKGNEWAYVKECLDSGWVSTAGEYVGRFEEQLKEITGAEFAIATATGTAALHMTLVCAGIGRGDEVMIPALTFVATANAVSYTGAIPHFADVSARTLGIDVAKLEDYLSATFRQTDRGVENIQTGRPLRAVIAMHTYGHACDLDELAELCDRWRLVLIEDAAESLGSFYKGQHTGNHGAMAALSFNGNKIATAGAGGAILTHDADIAAHAQHLTTTAKVPHAYEFVHDEVGYNYRLPNLNAALGCAQLDQLPEMLVRKRRLAEAYEKAFSPVSGVGFFSEPEHCKSNYWLNVILLDSKIADQRDTVLKALNDAKLGSRPAWMPMHRLAMYADCPKMDLSVTEDLYDRLICLPSSAQN